MPACRDRVELSNVSPKSQAKSTRGIQSVWGPALLVKIADDAERLRESERRDAVG